jgi:hypothetical protein
LRKLLAAVDETNNGEFLAFVVGDESSVVLNNEKLPRHFSHMTNVGSKTEKQKILAGFDLSGNISVSCIKFGLPELQDKIHGMGYTKKLRRHGNSINSGIAYEIGNTIRTRFENFITSNGFELG